MAEIKERKKKNGQISYTATIRIKGSPSVSKTFQRKSDAKVWAAKMEAEIRENINFPKRKLKKMTVGELINKFIEYELPKKKPKIQKDFLKSLNWYKQEIGNTYLSTLTTALFVECREKLCKKPKEIPIANKQPKITDKRLSNATINRYEGYMRSVFSYAVNDLDILDIHPMKKLKKLPEKNERKRYLDQKEIKKLLNACYTTDYELFLCVLIALLTGARKSEILKLTWANVNLEYKMFYFMDTKNGTDRGIPIHEFLYQELVNYKNNKKVRCLKNDYLFATENNKPREYLISKLFPKIVKKCQIEDFRFHDLRHTEASWQAMNGTSQPITQKTLGHKSSAMTNRYSHLRDEILRPAINSAGDVMLKDWLHSNSEKMKVDKNELRK